jgi:peptidyl-prolyl cis-trans isomerase SurA
MPGIRRLRSNSLFAIALLGETLLWGGAQPARAQAILMSVNGAPITSYDVDQRMKLLKILKKPASRDAAVEDLVADKVKLAEVSKFTITLSISDIMAQGGIDAQDAKIPPQAFAAALQQAGVDQANWKEHFKAEAEWNLYVKAMNKTLDISDTEVDAALAARGQKPGVTEYLVRQIVIVTTDAATAESKAAEAESIRARFDGCEKGVVMARAQPNVVVQNLVTRASDTLTDVARGELDKTPIGRLTSPQRGPEGIEMLALCNKKVVHDDTAVGQPIRDELLRGRLKKASDQLYAPLRARAVIVRFHS